MASASSIWAITSPADTDAPSSTKSSINFLWSTFTRFDPATDLHASRLKAEAGDGDEPAEPGPSSPVARGTAAAEPLAAAVRCHDAAGICVAFFQEWFSNMLRTGWGGAGRGGAGARGAAVRGMEGGDEGACGQRSAGGAGAAVDAADRPRLARPDARSPLDGAGNGGRRGWQPEPAGEYRQTLPLCLACARAC